MRDTLWVKSLPDTHVLLTNGHLVRGLARAVELAELAITYQHRVHCGGLRVVYRS